MSANYREHKQERDLKRRVASLEARVVWLEDVLARVLGQPAAPAEAANETGHAPSLGASAALDRFLLRTQPMSALAWPLLATSHGELVTLRPQADSALEPMLPFVAYPVGEGDVFTPSRLPSQLRPDEPAVAAPLLEAFDLEPDPAPPKAAAPPLAFNLGITAAFETLEGKVAEAAVAELASVRKRGPAAPAIELIPELIDLPPAPPRRLEVCCALELLNPSILQQVAAFWSSGECALRLQRLIGEDFGGRMGLDPLVREELKLLCAISASRGA